MRTTLFIATFLLLCQNIWAQNLNVYDHAPGAKVITSGGVSEGGGATERSFASVTTLSSGQHIVLDCRVPVLISSVTFGTFWRSDGRYIPKGYSIAYSNDGTVYTNIVTVQDNHNVSPVHSFSATSGRYWKLTVNSVQDGETYCSIAGLQLLSNGVGAASNNSFWNGGGFNSTSIHYNAGNVGIGTNTPMSQLHVYQAAADHAYSILERSNNGYQAFSVFKPAGVISSSNPNWLVGMKQTSPGFVIQTYDGSNSVDRFFIQTDGNVGVGTSTPQAKLAVNGDIFSKKVKVTQLGWPDYVFDPSYHLPTLSEVEAFIKQHKHLPDVPSARDVEQNGLDLGDNQATLLKKIEELTLYLIELTKKVEQLEELNGINQPSVKKY